MDRQGEKVAYGQTGNPNVGYGARKAGAIVGRGIVVTDGAGSVAIEEGHGIIDDAVLTNGNLVVDVLFSARVEDDYTVVLTPNDNVVGGADAVYNCATRSSDRCQINANEGGATLNFAGAARRVMIAIIA